MRVALLTRALVRTLSLFGVLVLATLLPSRPAIATTLTGVVTNGVFNQVLPLSGGRQYRIVTTFSATPNSAGAHGALTHCFEYVIVLPGYDDYTAQCIDDWVTDYGEGTVGNQLKVHWAIPRDIFKIEHYGPGYFSSEYRWNIDIRVTSHATFDTSEPVSFTTTITDVGAVPEPTTWAMLILGFGAIGTTPRRSRRPAQPALS